MFYPLVTYTVLLIENINTKHDTQVLKLQTTELCCLLVNEKIQISYPSTHPPNYLESTTYLPNFLQWLNTVHYRTTSGQLCDWGEGEGQPVSNKHILIGRTRQHKYSGYTLYHKDLTQTKKIYHP